jgi:hypothetical protein
MMSRKGHLKWLAKLATIGREGSVADLVKSYSVVQK